MWSDRGRRVDYVRTFMSLQLSLYIEVNLYFRFKCDFKYFFIKTTKSLSGQRSRELTCLIFFFIYVIELF